MEDLKVKKIIIEENALLNKSVTVRLLDYPNDKFVEVKSVDSKGLIVIKTYRKDKIFDDLDEIIEDNSIKKAKKTVKHYASDAKKTPLSVYNFESNKKSKKTNVRIISSKNGILEEDRQFLDSQTQYVRTIHFQSMGEVAKVVAGTIAVLGITAAIFIKGFMQNSLKEEMKAWESVRDRMYQDIEQGGSMNQFGEEMSDELYTEYKKNQQDNEYTPEEIDAYNRFWEGQKLTTIEEMKAFLEKMYELKDDYDDAKEDLGMSKGK